MTQQIMLTMPLNDHAFAFALNVANVARTRDVALNDSHAMHALVRERIASLLTTNARNDDDDDARAFASYLTRHDDAPAQSSSYRRRVVMFARNIAHARAHGVLLNVSKHTTRAMVIVDANDDTRDAFARYVHDANDPFVVVARRDVI